MALISGLLLVPGFPLLLAMGLMAGPWRQGLLLIAPWAALPALIISLSMKPGTTAGIPWLLFGTHLGFDETARLFLFFTGLLWLVSGVYAVGYLSRQATCSRARFFIWFLLAMSGNLGLILAQDMVIFYTFFALMSFASYGLVVHDGTSEALRAGRIYIVLAVVGEVLLFAAFVLAALAAGSIAFEAVRPAVAESELRNWIVGLALLGFGIKAGVIGLHVWLPLAHPVAPTPASAVLSGAMIAAGLLGWLRVLPLGEAALPGWGGAMMAAGVVAVFYAVLVGLMQDNPKTVLAYSSISKMGLMTMGVGLGLAAPYNWPLILTAILVFALHHGLAKGALFLGVGLATMPPASRGHRRLLVAGLLVPALSLAAAPLTSGMIAKNLLKVQATSTATPWGDWLQIILSCSSVATSLLMARFLYLVWLRHQRVSATRTMSDAMWLSWSVLVIVVAFSPWFYPYADSHAHWTAKVMAGALWPVVLGGGLAVFVWLALRRRLMSWLRAIPPGDLLVLVENRPGSLIACGRSFGAGNLPRWRLSLLGIRSRFRCRSVLLMILGVGERRFAHWLTGAILFLVLAFAFMFLAAR